MPDTTLTSHLAPQTTLASGINSWEAFLSNVRILIPFLPENTTLVDSMAQP